MIYQRKGPFPPPPPKRLIESIWPPPPHGIEINWKGIDFFFLGGGPPPLPPHVGNGFGVPRREVGYDRSLSLLKDRHVLVVHNSIETGNSHEHKCNRHFRKLLARLRDSHSKDSWHSCTTDITSYTEVLTLDTLARSQFQLIFTTELLGMVFACHEGTIGYDRLLLKDRHVLVVHNSTEIGNGCGVPRREVGYDRLLSLLKDRHVLVTQFYWNRKLPRTQLQQTLSQAFGTFARQSFQGLVTFLHDWYYFLYGSINFGHACPLTIPSDIYNGIVGNGFRVPRRDDRLR